MITDKQIWEILCNIERQGGNRAYVAKSNRVFEKVTEERDM
jgi:hypothetical protein